MIALLALAFVASLAAVRGFLALSRRRFLDQPGARSSHSIPTPTGGGFPAVLVFLGVSALAVTSNAVPGGPRFRAALLCAAMLSLLGLLDDVFDLPAIGRFSVHGLVACAVVNWVGHPGPSTGLAAWLAFVACVVMVVGSINAFNFMDGIDALVGGTGVIIVSILAFLTHDPLWFLLAASYAGFLLFNLPPARIFMGDAGSTVLGGLVGVALLSGREQLELRHLLLFAPLVGDSAYTVVRRLLRGENVLRAHHSHIYQRLLRAGHSHGTISAGYALATLLIALVVIVAGDVAALVIAVLSAISVIAIERYLTARGVPFTRPLPARASSSA